MSVRKNEKKKRKENRKNEKKFNKKVRKQQLRDFRAMASTCACAELYHSGQSCLQSLCYFCPAEDRDLWERDWSSESHTAYNRDFTFMSVSQFASVNRNRRLVAVFIDQFTVSTFQYLFMLTLARQIAHLQIVSAVVYSVEEENSYRKPVIFSRIVLTKIPMSF